MIKSDYNSYTPYLLPLYINMEDNKDKKNNQMDSSQHLPTKTQMLEHIYKVFANKSPNFWCLYKTKVWDVHTLLFREYNLKKNRDEVFLFSRIQGKYCLPTNDCEMLWHIVYIGNILLRFNWMTTVMTLTQWLWRYLDKPIDVQPIECIEYVYNLDPIKQETV